MKKLLILAILSALNAAPITLLDNLSGPKSALISSAGLYISNMGPSQGEANDGYITLYRDSKSEILPIALKDPRGLAMVASTLFVADNDMLVAIDENTKSVIWSSQIAGASLLSGIAILDNNTLFVGDIASGAIFRFDIAKKAAEPFITLDLASMGGPNGLAVAKGALFIAGNHPDGKSGGTISSINLNTKEISTVWAKKGAYDGIFFDPKGALYFSSWGEDLRGAVYRLNGAQLASLELPIMRGPAGFWIKNGEIYIPITLENRVIKSNLKEAFKSN